MKYLRAYNESTDFHTKEELRELIKINLEDNDFEVIEVYVTDTTANRYDTRLQVFIDENFTDSKIPEVVDLQKKLDDKHAEYIECCKIAKKLKWDRRTSKVNDTYREYQVLEDKLNNLILNINKKIIERICKKYGFEIQTIERISHYIEIVEGEEYPCHRVIAVIIPSMIKESKNQDEDILKFLYAIEEVDKELDAESDDHWSMQINADYDPNRDFIQVDYSSHGYSEGFSDSLRVYYKETPIRVERQNHGDTVFGEFDNQRTEEFNSLDDLIKDIKEEFGK
jgi:hypothetical protein